MTLSKIILIVPYFGSWPKWFPAFLLSCKNNNSIDWLIFTDCPFPKIVPSNVKFVNMNLDQLLKLAGDKIGFPIIKNNYSQVDLKPAYGIIFEEYIKGYDFWGHCDLDVIWGDLRHFIAESVLQNHDIISSRKNNLSGHFNLWKNIPHINNLFKEIPEYQSMLSAENHTVFDETIMSTFLNINLLNNTNTGKIKLTWEIIGNLLALKANFAQKVLDKKIKPVKIYWPEQPLIDWPELDTNPLGWYWEEGKLFDKNNIEKFYIHFMQWKSKMKSIDFEIGEYPKQFKILRRGIWSKQIPINELFFDVIQPRYIMKTMFFLKYVPQNMIKNLKNHLYESKPKKNIIKYAR